MKIFVCCSANNTIKDEYLNDCENALKYVLQDNDLVFGASNLGLMGMAYRIAKEKNRKIIGVSPKCYSESFDVIECDKEIETDRIMDSTKLLLNECDAVLILPGGFGTVYEFFTSIQSIVCQEKTVPIVLYNSCGYYDKLIDFINSMCEKGFAGDIREFFNIANNVEELKQYL